MTSDAERQLLRYLRGEMSAEETEALERRYFEDDEFFEELVAVDTDLIDAHTSGEMSEEDRRRFEESAALSSRRGARIQFSKALQRLTAEPPSNLALMPRSTAVGRPGGFTSTAWWGVAAAVVALLCGTWLAVSALKVDSIRSDAETERAGLRRRIQQLEAQVADQKARIEQLSRDLEAQRRQLSEPTPGPVREASIGKTVSFELIAGVLRDPSETTELVIPKDAETVLLRLGLESANYERYRAILERGGASLWQQAGLRPTGKASAYMIVLKIPSSLLGPGDYFVKLNGTSGHGPYESAGEYFFRVVKS